MMTPEQAVTELNALNPGDPEDAHLTADAVLLAVVPDEVREAYERVRNRIAFWYA